jgi:hypothetical protein
MTQHKRNSRDGLEISVCNHTASSRALMIQPQAANILTQYPRSEAIFSLIEDEDGEEKYAIGIVPLSALFSGTPINKRRNGRYAMFPPIDHIPIGRYLMRECPIYERGQDWFVLDKQELE